MKSFAGGLCLLIVLCNLWKGPEAQEGVSLWQRAERRWWIHFGEREVEPELHTLKAPMLTQPC